MEPPRSLPMFARTRSRTLGPKPALRRVAGGIDLCWTWSDTWGAARTLALASLDEGLDEGEPVLLWAGDEPEALFAEVGLQAVGALVIRVPLASDPGRVAEAALALGARRLLVFGPPADAVDLACQARPGLKARTLPSVPPAPPGDESRLDPWSDDPRLEDRLSHGGPDSAALVLLSGDDLDPAQARVLTQRNLLGVGRAVAAALGAGEEDTWWVAGPWRDAFQRTAGVAAAWLSGGELVLAPELDDPLQILWRASPSIGVFPASIAESLARRAAGELERAEGASGRLSRWMFRQGLRDHPPGFLDRSLRELAAATGVVGLSDVVGGRLTRIVVNGNWPDPESVRLLRALGVSTWAAAGNDATAGVAALGSLPSVDAPLPLLPGTRARVEEDGEVSIQGVSVSRRLVLPLTSGSPSADLFQRTGLKGRVVGDGVEWVFDAPPVKALS